MNYTGYDGMTFNDGTFMEEYRTKMVHDFDGFWTNYTWYLVKSWETKEVIRHVFILGDNDLFDEDDYEADWEADSEDEASEWFAGIDEDYFLESI